MSKKEELRVQRAGTVINTTSKGQEKECIQALILVDKKIRKKFKVVLSHSKTIYLSKIISHLKQHFPNIEYSEVLATSYMQPDGGVLYLHDKEGNMYPILISEVKNQGTNDARLKEGKGKQAKGNAIERLGKNVIGLRAYFLSETIFPFICFGYGCDFSEGSSILDRVVTINMYGKLNVTSINNQGEQGQFNRGSFYFRENKWTTNEMTNLMYDIALRSIYYYFSKHGEDSFI